MLRNKEFGRFVILFFALAAAVIVLGFLLNQEAGIIAAAAAVVFGAAFFLFTKARYHNIAKISSQIDLVLHDADRMELDGFDEGELSILNSEITKMTLRIREQNDALIKDKQYLADSLADIAHQLRTPLTSANLILSFLAKAEDEEERQAFVRETEELLVRMDRLITALLKLSRLDAGMAVFQRVRIDVRELILSAIRPLAIPMELRNIDLALDVPEGAAIWGDFVWLSESVQNILKNCMESAGENGRIEIACTDDALCTEITIHDSGAGFEAPDLPHLFDRFYRGKDREGAGFGIGLALCKMIVTRQNGSVTAKNHPQGGAVFSIRFPKGL
ncbi:MAG: HAMP domain-containing histidine kinase [Clostridiales Family XIII bacterium]|jgi:signal transduction histidine kinase|nr:HAMP domain-containing histidine kinase [Clostridiales Family XIII bacterium]